jgi:tRNA (cytidine/uridine-2'-O-)-methyltransferase
MARSRSSPNQRFLLTKMLNLVLNAPRIPHNTGQIARACHCAGSRLHLVRPLGFQIDGHAMRRAAVGYLAEMDIAVHPGPDDLWEAIGDSGRAWLITKSGQTPYTEVGFREGDWLIFGNETEGLPPQWLQRWPERTVRIPMPNPEVRCLNLATAAGVVLFEALRQIETRNDPSPGGGPPA